MTENPPEETLKVYGITLTIKKPLENTYSPRGQYYYTRIMYSKILGESCVDFRIYPEFTVVGRIHYHGLLKIKNFAKWVRTTLPSLRRIGYCKIESFKISSVNWETYMYKSLSDTKDILKLKEDINIEVTKKDYIEWKNKEPTIETFVGKPKLLLRPEIKVTHIETPPMVWPEPLPSRIYYDEDKNVWMRHTFTMSYYDNEGGAIDTSVKSDNQSVSEFEDEIVEYFVEE